MQQINKQSSKPKTMQLKSPKNEKKICLRPGWVGVTLAQYLDTIPDKEGPKNIDLPKK